MKMTKTHARQAKYRPFVLAVSLAAALMLYLVPCALAAKGIPTEVIKGKSAVLTVPDLKTVSISNPEIADVHVISSKEIQINGKKAGSTSMIVWDKKGTKTFFEVNVNEDYTLLEAKIAELAPGDPVKVSSMKNVIIASGTVSSQERYDHINNLLNSVGKNITAKDIVYLSGGIVKEVDTTGSVDETGIRFINMIEVVDIPQVLLQITVASIDRTATRELGLNWAYVGRNITISSAVSSVSPGLTTISGLQSGTHGGSLTTDGISGATLGVIHPPSGTEYLLHALASKGLAKILAEPNLLVKSGEIGRFLAGGSVPIPTVSSVGTSGGNAITVSYRDFGVLLNFKPVVKESGIIRLAIDPAEVSSISESTASVSGVTLPIFNIDRVSTFVDLKEGEAFVLAGLINEKWSKNITKLPILGDIPIIGAFFRTQKLSKEEQELVFFVTPKLMKPMAPGAKPEIPGANEPNAQQNNDQRWIPLMPTPHQLDPEAVK